jgi:hypothetical protein
MQVNVSANLSDLYCLVPNENPDEPYLWTFFLKLDGSTIRQVPGQPRFTGTVQVQTAIGSHGNLGATGVRAGRRIPIPPAIGGHAASLRPIEIAVPIVGTLRVPGQYIVAVILLEEDNSDSDGIENGHQAVRDLIELSVNEFIGGLDANEIFARAQERAPNPADVPAQAVAVVLERFDALTASIRDRASSAVELEVLAEHTPGFFWELFDQDELLDARTFRFDERDLLVSPLGPHRSLAEYLTETKDDEFISQYSIVGSLQTSFKATPADLRHTAATLSRVVGEAGSHVFAADDGPCVHQGQQVDWTRFDQVEEHVFLFRYPFLPLIWSIDGKDLDGEAGELRLSKTCTFPFFSPARKGAPDRRSETREVVISFSRFFEDGLPGIRLRNRPEDGSYTATLALAALSNQFNRTPLLSAAFGFDGTSLSSPFYAEFIRCATRRVVPLDAYPERWEGTPGPKPNWGPTVRQQWLDEQVRFGEQLVEVGKLTQARLASVRQLAQRKLGLE